MRSAPRNAGTPAWTIRASGAAARTSLERRAQGCTERRRSRPMRRVVRTDDHHDDVRAREEGLTLVGRPRLERAGKLLGDEVGGARAGDAVADDVDGPALGIRDPLRDLVGQRVLGAVDADPGRRRVTEHREPERLGVDRTSRWRHDVVDVESRVRREELHASQAHELDGHDAQEGADRRPDEPCGSRQPSIHGGTVPNSAIRLPPARGGVTLTGIAQSARADCAARHPQPGRGIGSRDSAARVGPRAAHRTP